MSNTSTVALGTGRSAPVAGSVLTTCPQTRRKNHSSGSTTQRNRSERAAGVWPSNSDAGSPVSAREPRGLQGARAGARRGVAVLLSIGALTLLSLSCGTSSRAIALGEGDARGHDRAPYPGTSPAGIGTLSLGEGAHRLARRPARVGLPGPCSAWRLGKGFPAPATAAHATDSARDDHDAAASSCSVQRHPRLADTGVRTGASLEQAGGPGERHHVTTRSSVSDRREHVGVRRPVAAVISIAIGSATQRLAQ